MRGWSRPLTRRALAASGVFGSLGELDGAGNAGAFDDCAEDVTGFGHELIGQFGVRCGSGDGFGHSVRELDLADQARVVVRAAD
jgi:hypothetical protein